MTADELRLLVVAPEIVVIDLVDHSLRALRLALIAEHPLLDDDHAPRTDPPVQECARAVLRHAARLRRALAEYRTVLDASLREAPKDDLPF